MQNLDRSLYALPVKVFSVIDFHYPIFADTETILAKYCSKITRMNRRMEGSFSNTKTVK